MYLVVLVLDFLFLSKQNQNYTVNTKFTMNLLHIFLRDRDHINTNFKNNIKYITTIVRKFKYNKV